MRYYIYDGSFSGLLTAIYQAFTGKERPAKIIGKEFYQENLFAEKIEIKTEAQAADRVAQAIKRKISARTLRLIYYVFLSEQEGAADIIFSFLELGFKIGQKLDGHYTDPTVLKTNRLAKRVSLELHRLLGLIRFQEIDHGIFYAPLEPDNNLLSLLAPHFVRRLADQNWLIHDRKRELAVVYNQEEWFITPLARFTINNTVQEKQYQGLWQGFFRSITIKNRENPKLQRQFMPKRYWKYLIEKDFS